MKIKKRHYFLRIKSAVVLLFLTCIFTQAQSSQSNSSGIIKDLRFHQLTSKIFGNTRTIRVLLPPDYHEPQNKQKRYPVLYLNDGQNLFDVATAVFNQMEWRVDETVEDLIKKKEIEPLIVVGIDISSRRGRENEYLPFEDKYLQPPLPKPQGYKYPDFLTEEVMPLINREYRTKRNSKDAVLGGSSYGALISLYTFIKKPNVFGGLLLESPSFYVSDAQILKDAQKLRKLPQKIYLGVGTNEEGQPNCKAGDLTSEAVQDVLKLKEILQNKKIPEKQMKVVIEDCAIHNENVWAKRLSGALNFLYKKD